MVVVRPDNELDSSPLLDETVLECTKVALSVQSRTSILTGPSYYLVKYFQDVLCYNPPSVLPPDRGVHYIKLIFPGTKYCVTRQWSFPKEQYDVIEEFFYVLSTRLECYVR